jgi:SH3-like domain-containing protein
MRDRARTLVLSVCLTVVPVMHAVAADFKAVAEAGAVLREAPASASQPLFVASRGLPVEVIATEGAWTRVRDPAGDMAWIETRALTERRTVLALVPVLSVHQRADDESPVVLRVAQGVVLELPAQGDTRPGWLLVRHRDGGTGYVRIGQVWGG